MLPDMAEKLGVPVDLMPRMIQDTSMSYLFGADMAAERADTWRRAVALGGERPGRRRSLRARRRRRVRRRRHPATR